jgi:type IV pilus assembly protein PilB
MEISGGPVDFRISILPTKFGESIVLRVLDRRRIFRNLGELAMGEDTAASIRRIVEGGTGLFLVTGPTGSGKTTTLYAALRELGRPCDKILTVEDPVEYEIDGCLQTPVDPALGRTFSTVLRAFLRHDPDGIFVGEIRDGETAQIALRAALTGHLVLSTLHTATAREALLRLEEMGVDGPLLRTCLRGILAQRLLRRNCPHCAATEEITGELPPPLSDIPRGNFRRGSGCDRCGGTGQLGRCAIFEFTDFAKEMAGEGTAKIPTPTAPTLTGQGKELVRSGEISGEEFARQLPWNR